MNVNKAHGLTGEKTHSDHAKTPRRDPRQLTNLQDILSCLSSYQSEEATLSNSLADLLSNRDSITRSLQQLEALLPPLDDLYLESSRLSDKVSSTARTAERVGGRVKFLDEEMRRVAEAADRVGQVMELKSSLSHLQSCIENQDWESATRHCARAMSLPLGVVSGPFAEVAVPTAESHLPPAQTLQAAREYLLSTFLRHFERASRSRDAAATSRYFKLFPAIGWEAEGLNAYAAFVVDLVRVRAPTSMKTSSPLYYVTALTALFESVAMIVDQHQLIVEKYYGSGKMRSVVAKLLEECDQVVKSTLGGWREDRSIRRKLSDILNFPVGTSTRKPPSQAGVSSDDDIDPREIDQSLSEIAGMSGRWSLFRKFLVEQFQDEDGMSSDDAEAVAMDFEQLNVPSNAEYRTSSAKAIQLLDDTTSRKEFEELLTSCYVSMEIWYIRIIIDKAHRLSSPDYSQVPPTTTTPDDVFYILKVVCSRLISTGSLPIVKRTTDLLKDVMDRDYVGGIKRKLEDVYKISGGTASGARPDKTEREGRTSFMVLLNDLDISSSHMDRLTKDLLSQPSITQLYLSAEQATIRSAITDLSGSTTKFGTALKAGVEQLFNQLTRPRLRMLIPDVYKDVSYILDEDAYTAAEYQDVVRKRFVKIWDGLVEGYRGSLTDNNFRMIFGLAVDVVLRPWERYILTLHYSELGAIRFDRDLRSIIAYLSAQTIFGDVREKFVRLQQISSLLNLDNDEDVETFYNGSGISWSLSMPEARNIVGLKV